MAYELYGNIGVIESSVGAVVQFGSSTKNDVSVTRVLSEAKDKQGDVASWGPNNDYPQKYLAKIKRNEAAVSGMRVIRKAHYGRGFVLTEEDFSSDKREVKQRSIREFKKINDFWKRSRMNHFWLGSIMDLEYWGIAFPEFILTKNYSRIDRVERKKTAHCRFEIMNEKTGCIENIYLSTKWGENPDMDSDYVAKIPLIDNYWSADEVKAYCKKHKIRNFVRPVFFPLIDESYYPDPEWHASDKSGWLDIANSIPEFKKAFLENQINIKFLIKVDEIYFETKYGEDWKIYEPERRDELRKELIQFLDETLRDVKNAGASIFTPMFRDSMGNKYPGLEIETIENKLQDGAYLDDTSAGTQQILTAIGVDPSLIGAGIPGGKLGAGSGSDKNQAWFILSAMMKTNRETTLDIFEFIKEYNNWPDNLIGAFEDTQLTTLDKNPTGTQNAVNV